MSAAREEARLNRRAGWLKTLHRWHWISSAVCLFALLGFAATGITLNHATQIEATPAIVQRTAELPASLLRTLGGTPADDAPLPAPVQAWLRTEFEVDTTGRAVEWSDDEAYVSLPEPGGDAWLSIARDTGAIEYERTDRGVIAWLNDLHKGRHTGTAWRWFIDVVAIACLVFSLTGLWLLQLHARQRGATWPLVALGVLVPALIVVLAMH